MNIYLCLLLIAIVAVVSYIIGLRRGCIIRQNDYDDGYEAAMNDIVEFQAEEARYEKARELVRQLDDLFDADEEEEVEVLDGGEY